MTYVKAGVLALFVALILGAASGAWSVLVMAVERLPPEDKATVLAQSISVGMNSAAFLAVVLIPCGLVVAHALRRWKRVHSAEYR